MISGIIKTSLIDYPKKLSCVIFISGCNFRCSFCHNKDLINVSEPILSIDEFEQFLIKRSGQLEGVVITGGEPTLNKNLKSLLCLIKHHHYDVKLDTNGSRPLVIEDLIKHKLVDYIAMDIKGLFSKYSTIISNDIDIQNIKKSISIIMNSGIDYEFRTTVMKEYHNIEDFKHIGMSIKGAKKFYLQKYRYNKNQLKNIVFHSLNDNELNTAKEVLNNYVKEVYIRS